MKNEIDYQRAENRLNSVRLRDENAEFPFEILNVRYVQQIYEKNMEFHTPYMHRHAFFELHLPIIGEQTYQLHGENIVIRSNEVIMFFPNTQHSIPYSSDNLKKFRMCFRLLRDRVEEEDSFFDGNCFNDIKYIKLEKNSWFVTLFLKIFQEADQTKAGWISLVHNLISQLIMEIFREYLPKKDLEMSVDDRKKRTIYHIERFVKDNVSIMLTGQMVAEQMFLSIRQLNRITMEKRGLTVKALINQIKMQEAKRLLEETNMELNDIYQYLGFSEVSSFCRFFSKNENCTPSEYRKRIQDLE